MFATFLFLAVFIFYCCLYNDMRCIATRSDSYPPVTTAKPRVDLPTATIAPQQPETVDEAVLSSTNEAIEQLPRSEHNLDKISKNIVTESLVLEQITLLKLREARIVSKQLEIAQKVNSKDKPLDWLQREIRQKLTSDRALVVEALQQLKAS